MFTHHTLDLQIVRKKGGGKGKKENEEEESDLEVATEAAGIQHDSVTSLIAKGCRPDAVADL